MNKSESRKKYADFYAHKENSPLVMREFSYYSAERWIKEGHISSESQLNDIFDFDTYGIYDIYDLGWCEAPFFPFFEEKILEDRGDTEVVRDFAGRSVLYFKNRRNGFMPEYLEHPVVDESSFCAQAEWRLDFDNRERQKALKNSIINASAKSAEGLHMTEHVIGGFMYLRSLMGIQNLLFSFYDQPQLIHRAMRAWLTLNDKVIAEHQKNFDIDELFLAEDICYKTSALISLDMIREFLLPYYSALIDGCERRKKDRNRKIHIQIDTDGKAETVIDVYREIGMDYMSPFEVASGSDVTAIRKKYPDLLISGGFDKRILSTTKDAIDREVDRIMPFMKKYGGYIPTCDHGVPEEVSFENYVHFRNRLKEFSV